MKACRTNWASEKLFRKQTNFEKTSRWHSTVLEHAESTLANNLVETREHQPQKNGHSIASWFK